MNRGKRNKSLRSPAKSRDAPSAKVTGWPVRWLVVAISCGVAAALWWFRSATPTLPELKLDGVNSIVRSIIERRVQDVRQHPRSGAAWGGLGTVLYGYHMLEPARVCLVKAEHLDSSNPRWPYFQGLIATLNSPGDALPPLRRAAELTGNDSPTPRLRLARVLGEQGRWAEADQELGVLLAVQPNLPHALLLRAQAAYAVGDLQRAGELAERCVGEPPTAKPALAFLAMVYRRRGELAAAGEASLRSASATGSDKVPDTFEKEINELRSDPYALSERVHPLMAAGRLEEAAAVVVQMQQLHPDFPDTWLAAGRLEILRKNLPLAEQQLRRHLELDAKSIQGWFQLGMALLHAGKLNDSAEAFRKAIKLKPDFAAACFNRAVALGRAGRQTEAEPALREAIRISPEYVDSYILLADLYLQRGEKSEVTNLLETAEFLNPTDHRLQMLRQKAAAMR